MFILKENLIAPTNANITAMALLYVTEELLIKKKHNCPISPFTLFLSFAYKLKPGHVIKKVVLNGNCDKELLSNVFFL